MPDSKVSPVAVPSQEYLAMALKWPLIEDLYAGTNAMRLNAAKWLPSEPREEPGAYQNRVNRSFLYNAYKKTLDTLVSKPFSRPVNIKGAPLPETLIELNTDADKTGRDITAFARDVFRNGIHYGLTHVLIDYPNTGGNATIAEDQAKGNRPIFIHIPPPNLLGWRTSVVNGQFRVDMIRWKECGTVADGEYGEKQEDRIRVYTDTTWEVHVKQQSGDYVRTQSGTHTFGEVPIRTFYVSPDGVMTGCPTLEDLAWVNLEHFQSSSDQRNILRMARCGILFAAGFKDGEVTNGVTISATQMVASANQDAKLTIVEHSGAAIGAGKEDLVHLEQRMETLGLQPLVERSSQSTATGKSIDDRNSNCDIQSWVRLLESFLHSCYESAAQWLPGTELPADFSLELAKDFGLALNSATDIQALKDARVQGDITRKTYLNELKRRSVLSESLDIQKEIDEADLEGPPLSNIFTGLNADPTNQPPPKTEAA